MMGNSISAILLLFLQAFTVDLYPPQDKAVNGGPPFTLSSEKPCGRTRIKPERVAHVRPYQEGP